MKILLAQMRVRAGTFDENYCSIEKIVEDAKSAKADLVVLPEMCIAGYFVGDEWERNSFLRDAELIGRAVAKLSTPELHIVFGNVGVDWENRGEDGRTRKYNACFHAHNGVLTLNKTLGLNFWPKTLLPNYREFDDSRHFYDLRKLAMERNCSISDLISPLSFTDSAGIPWTVGLGICEDAWSSDYNFSLFDYLAGHFNIDFFLSINGSPYTLGKIGKREKIFGSLTSRTGKPLMYTNCNGVQNVGKTVFGFDGSCGVVNKNGQTEFRGNFFNSTNNFFNVIKQNETKIISVEPTSGHLELDRAAELRMALEASVANILEEWKINRVVVGVSGGVDSAVAATLFSRVLGPHSVFLVNMPTQFNSSLTKGAAAKLADNLCCPYAVVPIEREVENTKAILNDLRFSRTEIIPKVTGLVHENIQARDRGSRILAGIAAALGGAISCNANKSEVTVGYSTLYGDLIGFLAPLADLWKHDVYALANHYNDVVFKREIIPSETLNVKPSAELSSDQDVTQGKGDPLIYEYHDYLFKSWVESWRRCNPYDILLAYSENRLEELIGCEVGLVKRIFPSLSAFISDLERWWVNYQGMGAVKRMQAPPIVAVTQRAFGFDHRESLRPVRLGIEYEQLKENLISSEGLKKLK